MSHKNSFQQKSSCLKVTNASIVKAHECKVCKIKINNIGKLLLFVDEEGRCNCVYLQGIINEGIKTK